MEKWIDKIFSLKTFPGKLIFVLWFSSCLLILLPERYLAKFLLLEFKNSLGLYIGPVALTSSAVLLWILGKYIANKISTQKYIKNRKNLINKSIDSLNFSEITLLREFYIQGKDTILIPYSNETVIALENKGIVYKATNSAIVGGDMGYPFSLSDYAKNCITPNKLILPENENEFSESRQREIFNERPDWAKEMQRKKELFNSRW